MHWIDHDSLPETRGIVERFVMNSRGEIDGLLLDRGTNETTLVHVPPHLSAEIEAGVRPGEAVRVHGVRPRGTHMIAAVALIAADGRAIIDNGPDDKQRKDSARNSRKDRSVERLQVAGIVRLSLYAPKGELRGALLQDGSIVRIDPKEAQRFAKLLQPGASVAVRGDGIETPHGRVVEGREIGNDLEDLEPTDDQKYEKRPPVRPT
jgi:hypothetical protein